MKLIKEIDKNNVILRLFDNDVVEISRPKDWSIEETLEDAKFLMQSLKEFVGNNKYRILGYLSDATISDDARSYYADYNHLSTASALVTINDFQRAVGHLLIEHTIISEKIPYKMFSTREKAIEWLMQFPVEVVHERNLKS